MYRESALYIQKDTLKYCHDALGIGRVPLGRGVGALRRDGVPEDDVGMHYIGTGCMHMLLGCIKKG